MISEIAVKLHHYEPSILASEQLSFPVIEKRAGQPRTEPPDHPIPTSKSKVALPCIAGSQK
jgi:hypothetical protein